MEVRTELRALMKLCRGFLIMLSNFEFFDSSAIDLISSYRKPIIRSILVDSNVHISVMALFSFPLKK